MILDGIVGWRVCPLCGYTVPTPEVSAYVIEKQHRHDRHDGIFMVDYVWISKINLPPVA